MIKNFFNFKRIGNSILLTNDTGHFTTMSCVEFTDYINNNISTIKKNELIDKGFLCCNPQDLYVTKISKSIQNYKKYLFYGTKLHIFVLTNKCNNHCVYCQASANNTIDSNMTKEVAKASVDLALQSPSNELTFEFQGGEPLLNFDTLKYIINYTNDVNSHTYHKSISFSVVSNLILLTPEMIAFFKEHDVSVSTSIDGPIFLQYKNRPSCNNLDYYSTVEANINLLRKSFVDVQAIETTTRYSLAKYKEIIDEYVNLGFNHIFIRPLTPVGFAKTEWSKIGYTPEEYVDFYTKSLSYINDLNNKGVEMSETYMSILLDRILYNAPSSYMELRSPCGASIGQIAYNYNGNVYTCDEGRMLGEIGDQTFRIGNVFNLTYQKIIESPVTKAVSVSSCLETTPICESCVWQPYCGTCPILNYVASNNIFMKTRKNYKCKINSLIFEYLFKTMLLK